jgi:hypothetical protein
MAPAKMRKNLLKLDRIDTQILNDGFEAMVAVEGPGGYQHIAGLYRKLGRAGRPTDPSLFLPWHRAYLIAFERALERLVPGAALAYWAWSDEAATNRGFPGRLRSMVYSDKEKNIWLNAICRAPIDGFEQETFTERSPGTAEGLVALAHNVAKAVAEPRYEDFSAVLAQTSEHFHGWVGGHFATDDFAAYDPAFWFHYANLDRIWSRWQRQHPQAKMPASLLDSELAPFSITVGDVLQTERVGYTYDDLP